MPESTTALVLVVLMAAAVAALVSASAFARRTDLPWRTRQTWVAGAFGFAAVIALVAWSLAAGQAGG